MLTFISAPDFENPGDADGDNVYEVQVTASDGTHDSLPQTIMVSVSATGDPALRTGVVNGVSDQQWTTVTLDHTYAIMVVVLSPNYGSGDAPLIARVRNAAGNSFEVRVQRADNSQAPISGVTVHYTVVEEGVYNEAEHGVKMEAVKITSTRTDSSTSWVGQRANYGNSYINPVVVGQVMTSNDPDPSVFWARGGSFGVAPSTDYLYVGKHVGEDSDKTRAAEQIGYIVIESGTGSIGTTGYMASVGANSVVGPDSGSPVTYRLSGFDSVSSAVVSAAGIHGLNGGWPVLAGTGAVTPTGLDLMFDEDQWYDAERVHLEERVAYVVFGDLRDPPTPNLRTGTVSNVGNSAWTTVTLDHTYASMVVVSSPNYGSGDPPLMTRVRNAAGNSFEVQVQRADNSQTPISGVTVHYTVVEEGVYNQAEHGVTMEAVKTTSTRTIRAPRGWASARVTATATPIRSSWDR